MYFHETLKSDCAQLSSGFQSVHPSTKIHDTLNLEFQEMHFSLISVWAMQSSSTGSKLKCLVAHCRKIESEKNTAIRKKQGINIIQKSSHQRQWWCRRMIEHLLNFYHCENNLLFSWLCTEMPQSLTEWVSKKWYSLFSITALWGQCGILYPHTLNSTLPRVFNLPSSFLHFVTRLIYLRWWLFLFFFFFVVVKIQSDRV